MGISYSFCLGIGFTVDFDTLGNCFRQVVDEVFHMEDCYDSKTGQKLEPVKIVDKKTEDCFVFENETFDYASDVGIQIALKLGCEYSDNGGMGEPTLAYFTVPLDHTDDDDIDQGNITVSSSILYDQATSTKTKQAVKKLGQALKEFGLNPSQAKILVRSWIG